MIDYFFEKYFEAPHGYSDVECSWLYFIQGIQTGLIKIGKTGGVVSTRQFYLQVGSAEQLVLLKAVQYPDEVDWEALVHEEFDEYRVRGEWFQPSDSLMDFIDNVDSYYFFC